MIASMAARAASRPLATAFEVPNILRVHAHDGGADDLAAIARDLGPSGEIDEAPPDLIVHFVDGLSARRVYLLDGGTMGYGDDGVYFFDSSGRIPIARVSQGECWGQARVVCRRGLKRIPFLAASLDLAALRRGWAPLHGSAWITKGGAGVLVTGWAGSGKTGALLAACEVGATPVGDDRILLSADGSRMMGLGRPMVVKDWHLAQLGIRALGAGRVRRTLARASLGLAARLERSASRWARGSSRALGRIRRELSVELDPRDLAGLPAPPQVARPDVLVMLETHRHPDMVSESVDARTAAGRVAAQVEAELLPTLRAQTSFEYASPGRGWGDVGRAPEIAARILREAIPRIPTFLVRHPHPCSLKQLEQVIATVVGRCAPQPVSS